VFFSATSKAFGIDADFALGDDAALCWWMNSIGSSMVMMWPRRVQVAVADHRRQRGGFAGAGGADENDQPRLVIASSLMMGGQLQVVQPSEYWFRCGAAPCRPGLRW
jgi:hypothetical protein